MRTRGQKLLFQEMSESTKGIEHLLSDYSNHVSREQADFIRAYMRALRQDFEVAMTRGAHSQLAIIVEDLQELRQDTYQRLFEAKLLQS